MTATPRSEEVRDDIHRRARNAMWPFKDMLQGLYADAEDTVFNLLASRSLAPEVDPEKIVRMALARHQSAYAYAHCTEHRGVIESEDIAIKVASQWVREELLKGTFAVKAPECATCNGEKVVQSKPTGSGHSDDLAEYVPCPTCAQPPQGVSEKS